MSFLKSIKNIFNSNKEAEIVSEEIKIEDKSKADNK